MLFLKTCIDQKKILLTWLQADGLLFKEEQLRLNEAFFPERSKRLNCYVTYAKKISHFANVSGGFQSDGAT